MKNLNLELYKKLYLIRRAEKIIIKEYPNDEMKTPMHMSMGGEAISVGVCKALGRQGQFFGTYRSHALYLSVTGETDSFFAEMYGKAAGRAKGKAGSMHLSAPDKGLLGTSAIVASTIPVAIGAAFANKYQKNGKITAVFFGDGAIDEGNFWESLNMACVLKLPVIFICEDNDFAMHTQTKSRHGYQSIAKVVAKFNCHTLAKDTTDVEKIYRTAKKALGLMQKSLKPCFLYFKYYRYLEHVGIYHDFDAGYRDRKEFEKWLKIDPIDLQRKKLLELGVKQTIINNIEKQINRQINKSVQFAKNSPFACAKELFNNIFYE